MDAASDAAALDVRSRQIRSGNGWTVTEFTVDCPFRDRSIDLDDCEQCAAYEGIAQLDGLIPRTVACARIGPLDGRVPPAEKPDDAGALARSTLAITPVLRAAAKSVTCVQREISLREVAGIFVRERISGVPVVDDDFRPLGMITKTDLLRLGLDPGDGTHLPPAFSAHGSAGDAMTAAVAAICEHASVLEAAGLMAERGLHRLAITARDGRIVGLVTALDLLRWLARPA